MPHVVVAGGIHPAGLDLLRGTEGVTLELVTDPDPRAYLAALPRAEGLILRTQKLTAADVANAPSLSVVARHGVGYDAVDVAALDARGIPLAIVGDVNSRTVAEHTMMLLLAASRRLVRSFDAVRGGDWAYRDSLEPQEVDGKTLLIVGFGRIGRHLRRLAEAFGMRVLVHDPFLPPDALDGAEAAESLEAGLAACDCLSVHVPKTDGPLIGAAELARMKRGAVVVNAARGGVIDEAALADALESGQIGAAGLDVLADEPPPEGHPLILHPNAIVTPHSAGLTEECARRMSTAAARNVLAHFDGRLDPGLVVNLKG